MKIEISGATGSPDRVVRVTVNGYSETLTHGEFSKMLASPLPLSMADVITLRLPKEEHDA